MSTTPGRARYQGHDLTEAATKLDSKLVEQEKNRLFRDAIGSWARQILRSDSDNLRSSQLILPMDLGPLTLPVCIGGSRNPPPPPAKLGHQHAVFPLPEGSVSLSFPAELSAASAGLMESFIKLAVEQAKQQAALREQKKNEAAN